MTLSFISMNLFFRIANASTSDRNSTDWFQSTSFCNNNSNDFASLKKSFGKLIVDFDRMKIQFSSGERRPLRQYFLHLAEQCIKLKDFKSAIIITENLADSAYKLPYCKYYK